MEEEREVEVQNVQNVQNVQKIRENQETCPICTLGIEEQPDGISLGKSSIVKLGCCHKVIHAMCWERCEKLNTWTEDKVFDPIRKLLVPDKRYEAHICPFCRYISDIRMIEPTSTSSQSSHSMHPSVSIGLDIPENVVQNVILETLLNQIITHSIMNDNNDIQPSRPRHMIHPYSNQSHRR